MTKDTKMQKTKKMQMFVFVQNGKKKKWKYLQFVS